MWTMSSPKGVPKQSHGCSCQGCKATNHTGTLLNLPKHWNSPEPSEPSGSCLRNLHQHTTEPSGTFRNLPPEPTPTHTGTLRNLLEPASRTYTSKHRNSPELSGTLRNSPELSGTCLRNLHQHTPELSGTCLRNLHQHTPELSGTFWNLPPEPTPANTGTLRNSPELSGTLRNSPEPASGTYTSTHRNSPEPSSGTCSCDPHRHTPELIWAEDPISLRCWGIKWCVVWFSYPASTYVLQNLMLSPDAALVRVSHTNNNICISVPKLSFSLSKRVIWSSNCSCSCSCSSFPLWVRSRTPPLCPGDRRICFKRILCWPKVFNWAAILFNCWRCYCQAVGPLCAREPPRPPCCCARPPSFHPAQRFWCAP